MINMARRTHRRKRTESLSKTIRTYMLGFVFLAIAAFLIAIPTFFAKIIPNEYVYLNGSSLGVGSSIPSGATGFSVSLIVLILGVAVGLFAVFKAVRYFGLHL